MGADFKSFVYTYPHCMIKAVMMTPDERIILERNELFRNIELESVGYVLEDCMVLMTAKQIRHLPVFEDSRFVGLISIGDVVKAIISEKQSLIDLLHDYISGKLG